METAGSSRSEADSPLELFLRDYAELSGGLWDEVEPQVYDLMLPPGALAESPWTPLPEARHAGLAATYPIARDRVVRTLAALANTRARELEERLARQVQRMRRYYSDLRSEVDEQAERARGRGEDVAKFNGRREALERAEHLRGSELRPKSTLKVHR